MPLPNTVMSSIKWIFQKLKWLIQWDLVIRQLLGLPQLSIIRKTTKHFLTKANVLGMLNAQEATTGHINIHRYDDLYQQINVKEV